MKVWTTIALCTLVTIGIKGAGPLAFGGRSLPAPVTRVVLLLAPALLAALVTTNALANGRHLHVGADTAGVLVAGGWLWRKGGVLPAVVIAAAVAAGCRALGWDD